MKKYKYLQPGENVKDGDEQLVHGTYVESNAIESSSPDV